MKCCQKCCIKKKGQHFSSLTSLTNFYDIRTWFAFNVHRFVKQIWSSATSMFFFPSVDNAQKDIKSSLCCNS